MVAGDECSQFDVATAQGVQACKALQKSLPGCSGLQPSRPAQAVAGGNVTPNKGFGRLTPGSVQAGADVAGKENDAGHRFEVRLVMVANDRVRGQAGPTQGTTEESFCTGAVAFIAQQNIEDLAVLVAA